MKKTLSGFIAGLQQEMLLNIENEDSFIAGVLHNISFFEIRGKGDIYLKVETERIFLIKKLFSFLKQYSLECEINIKKKKNHELKKIEIIINYNKSLEKFCNNIRFNMFDIGDLNFLKNNDCISSYLKGVFLSCGYIENIYNGYYLEFYFKNKDYSEKFLNFFKELIRGIKYRQRNKVHTVFIQTKKGIEDFINVCGAHNSYFKFLDFLIIREIKEGVNRKANFELANIERTSNAYIKFFENYNYFLCNGGLLENLPPKMVEIINIRIEEPELNLSQIGDMLVPKIKKSSVNYWIKKFYNIVENMKKDGF